eukprot:4580262-Amphidinium_carterae.1
MSTENQHGTHPHGPAVPQPNQLPMLVQKIYTVPGLFRGGDLTGQPGLPGNLFQGRSKAKGR